MTVGHQSPPKVVVSYTFPWQPRHRPLVFLSFPPPSSSPTSSPSDRAVSETSVALPKCCCENPRPCCPRRILPTPQTPMTVARQSLRTRPFSPPKAQVQRIPLIPLSSMVPHANEFLPRDRTLPSPLGLDPLQPPSPPPLSTPTIAHDPAHHLASSIASPQKMQPLSLTPIPVREAR